MVGKISIRYQSKISNLCITKCYEDKHADLFLIGKGEKKHYVHIKDFNTLHRVRKHFCCYCWQGFRTAENLKCHIKECFEINGKQTIDTIKKVEYMKFKSFWRKIKITIHDLSRICNYSGA